MAAEDLNWAGWVVIITVIIALLIMATDMVGPDLVFSVLLAFYMASGILTVAKASANYGNSGLLTVIMLYLVAEGIYQTGGLESVMVFILGRSRSPFWANVRMMLPTMVLSAFLNNTPVVSLLTPILISWSRRTGVPAKKVLIPLSYASVLGGTCTLIGTSTNLVISGQQTARYERLKQLEDATFRIFDIAPYGITYAIWGFMFVILTQKWLLPGNSSRFAKNILMALRVSPTSPVRGKAILDTGLHRLHGAQLAALSRNGVFATGPSPKLVLDEGDVLYFAGEVDTVLFYGEDAGLVLVSNETEDHGYANDITGAVNTAFNKLTQVHVSAESPLVGQRIGSARDLKARYDLRVLGYERSAGAPDGKLNDHVIKAGDILIVDAGTGADFTAKEFQDSFTKHHLLKDSLAKEFIVAYTVTDRQVAGKTVSGSGLRGIPGLAVVAVDQGSKRHEPVDHETTLQVGDTVWVLADIQGVIFLNKFPGLQLSESAHIERTGVNILYRKLSQAVVSKHSSLVGKTVVSARFRRKYKACVIGWHREETRTVLPPKDVVIQAGDVLLIMASETFAKDNHHDRNFIMIDDIASSNPPKKNRAIIAIFLGLAMITTQIAPGVNNEEWIHLWPCSILTWGLMILTGCMSGDDARRSILWDVYLCIAAAFGVSNAMEGTGVANEFAQVFISIARAIGTEGAGLTSIYVATALLSEILTNNASGAIMYPIAAVAGDALGIAPRKMSIAIMLGASAGFINPFSYQCNLMVYTAGNYRTLEFAKIGAPFQVYLLVVAAFILHFMDDWHTVWIVSFVVMGVVIGVPALWALVPERLKLPLEEKVDRAGSSFKRVVTFGRSKGSQDLPTIKSSDSFGNGNHTSRSSSADGVAPAKPTKI